jgi:hypothetical protein
MMGFMAIFQALSLYMVGMIVPLIPTLYNLFVKLSTFQFLSNSYIHSVWNNIYVLVGVIVMFAIAIKLISTIVNPDTIADNKKGVKGIYFRTIIAVVMIFIIPMLFTYSFELQKKLIDSNFLISRVFGYKISDDTSVGQLLAWTTFSSFCTLGEDANEGDVIVYNRTKEDLSYLVGLTARIRTEDPFGNPAQATQGVTKYGSFNYHSILCPLSVFLVAYELLLLCMDTLFRAAKLALLELMLPIVLGAFVFNPEILKKWAKEFISTYLSLFLKVIAIGFMVISFISIKAYIEGDTFFEDWLMQGFFNILFIIALLQLVKKIPEIINTVFGTHIKTAGGIKGRLGEMAGIGGMAAKAWTSLGTGLKNAGKMALMAPAAGAALGANAWYRSKHGGKSFTETNAFRQGKGILYGLRSGLKTGSVMNAYQDYEKMSAVPIYSNAQLEDIGRRARTNMANITTADGSKGGFTSNGNFESTKRDSNGNILHANGDIQYYNRNELNQQASALSNLASTAFNDSARGRQLATSMSNGFNAQRRLSDLQGIENGRNKVLDILKQKEQDMINSGQYGKDEIEKVTAIRARFEKGKGEINESDWKTLSSYMSKAGGKESEAFQFQTAVKKYDRALNIAAENNQEYKVEDLLTSASLGGLIKSAETDVSTFESDQQDIISRMSDADKAIYKTYSGGLKQIASFYGITNQNAGDQAAKGVHVWSENKNLIEETMVERATELRKKRATGLTPDEEAELKGLITSIREYQAARNK